MLICLYKASSSVAMVTYHMTFPRQQGLHGHRKGSVPQPNMKQSSKGTPVQFYTVQSFYYLCINKMPVTLFIL